MQIYSHDFRGQSCKLRETLQAASGNPWLAGPSPNLCLHPPMLSFPVCVSPLLSLIKTLVIQIRALFDDSEWSHLKIMNYICKSPFSRKLPLTSFRAVILTHFFREKWPLLSTLQYRSTLYPYASPWHMHAWSVIPSWKFVQTWNIEE